MLPKKTKTTEARPKDVPKEDFSEIGMQHNDKLFSDKEYLRKNERLNFKPINVISLEKQHIPKGFSKTVPVFLEENQADHKYLLVKEKKSLAKKCGLLVLDGVLEPGEELTALTVVALSADIYVNKDEVLAVAYQIGA